MNVDLSDDDKRYLLKLARMAIEEYLKSEVKIPPINPPPATMKPYGVFVTLEKKPAHELRGCVGYPLPIKPLCEAVVDNALNAAFHDSRFPPLSAEELKDVEIEITILSEPELIEYDSPDDLLSKIKIGRDGLILKHGWNAGLLLPQVPVEEGWSKEEYLSYLCLKAGLPPDTWLKEPVRVERFEGVKFSESELL